MKLTFLGTRGEIDARTRHHRMHCSVLVSYRSARVMIDCGLHWLGKFERLRPSAIVLTHAHPDPRLGLEKRRALSRIAPEKTWQTLNPDPLVRPQPRKNVLSGMHRCARS